ncbi:MAG: L,D-transpeptidase family protein [Sphingomicrobium sp.]
MIINGLRGGLAALLMAFAPTVVQAETPLAHPAIASSLAIPGEGLTLPAAAPTRGRVVLVDAGSAQLYMIEDGQVVDSMRVIVGKGRATPTLTSTIHYATLNPYWYVPPDLARKIIAPNVVKDGSSYLRSHGYEVVSAFNNNAEILSPTSVDWKAVAAGTATAFVRQRPGPANSMGRMKFGFGNVQGIFLHDTPRKELFAQDQRDLSNGCVRLEDAPRLARWLLGSDANTLSDVPDQHIALPKSATVVIAYLGDPAPAQMAALR